MMNRKTPIVRIVPACSGEIKEAAGADLSRSAPVAMALCIGRVIAGDVRIAAKKFTLMKTTATERLKADTILIL